MEEYIYPNVYPPPESMEMPGSRILQCLSGLLPQYSFISAGVGVI